jgi:hypothetical protein
MSSTRAYIPAAGAGSGRILRVKLGYNPNSSSVGSNIPAFLAFAAGSGAVSVFVLCLLAAADKRLRNLVSKSADKDREVAPKAELKEEKAAQKDMS